MATYRGILKNFEQVASLINRRADMRTHRRVACVVGTIACIGIAASCGNLRRSGREELIAAYSAARERPLTLRLSGFPYAPARKVVRGNAETPRADSRLLKCVYAVLTTQAGTADDSTLAAAQLLAGNPQTAATAYERSLRKTPANATLWNDLSVALYEVAQRDDDPRTFGSALAAADRALSLAPNLAEAAFNRAAILESLALRVAASQAWKRCLDLDHASAWAPEIRAALDRDRQQTEYQKWEEEVPQLEQAAVSGDVELLEGIVRRYPQQARNWAEGFYLSRWGEQLLAGNDEEAERMLLISRRIGERLLATATETLLSDAVDSIDRTIRRHDPHAITNLGEAYAAYAHGRLLIRDRKPAEARPLLEDAERRFTKAGSPMSLVARYYRAGTLLDETDAEAAIRLLDSIEKNLKPGYLALRAQTLWERARIQGRLGHHHDSLRASLDAAALFERLGERESAARNQVGAALALSDLGRPHEEWRLWKVVFAKASDIGSPTLLQAALHAAAREELKEKERMDVARSLLDLLVNTGGPSPLLRFDALLWQTFARVRSAVTLDTERAIGALNAATQAIPDPGLRRDAEDELRFCEALLIRERNPQRAIWLLNDSVLFRRNAGRHTRVAEAQLQRALAHRQNGTTDLAMEDLKEVLDTLEQQRAEVGPADLRDSFFAAADEACDALIGLHLQKVFYDAAFATAERCRARTLLDFVASEMLPEQVKIGELQRSLSKDTVVIAYSVLPQQLVTWIISASKFEMLLTSDRTWREAAQSLAAAIENSDPNETRRSSSKLYDALVAPAIRVAGVPKKMLIVPDTEIGAIPFALLYDPYRNRYLVEDCEITITPSIAAYLNTPVSMPPDRAPRVLVLGDPAFSHEYGRTLSRLPEAIVEANAVAEIYPGATLLLGNNATREEFVATAGDSDIIHVAAHAELSALDARNSALLLAESGKDDGLLTLKDVGALKLARKPVVILTGCKTGVQGGGLGAVRSLSYAFLAAGSRAVVGSLWNVEDEGARFFAASLHRRLIQGMEPAQATRETQLEMRASRSVRISQPSTWAAFQLYAIR